MKKLLLLLLLCSLTTHYATSQTVYYKSDRLVVRHGGVHGEWADAAVDIVWEVARKRFTIHSNKVQIYDYVSMNTKTDADGTMYNFPSTDTHYQECTLFMYITEDTEVESIFLGVHYTNNDLHMYRVIPIKVIE